MSDVETVERREQLQRIAVLCEEWASSVFPADEACASSMDFVALRLRRLLAREAEMPKE
jgi:hypothetical protein